MDLTTLMWEMVGLALTLMVFLYLFVGDNALFRIVTYTFIGIAAGYVAVVVIFQVLLPRLSSMLFSSNIFLLVIGLILITLGAMLFFKLSPRLSSIGTLPMAILVGIGAAVAVGGALFGTLAGQVIGTVTLFPFFGDILKGIQQNDYSLVYRLGQGLITALGAVTTLAYFQFSTRTKSARTGAETEAPVRRQFGLEVLSKIGQVFIGITLGAMFAGVYTAAISALIERIGTSIDAVTALLRYLKFL